MRVRFFYDVVCPYAWMAATEVEALAARHGATVQWCPVLLGGIFRHHEAPDVPAASWAPAKAAVGRTDVHRMAALHNLPLRFPDDHPRRTVDAMRLCTAAPAELRAAVSLALYRAIWTEDRDPADSAVLAEIAHEHGIVVDRIRSAATRDALRANTQAAAELGVFGVPSLQVVHPDGASGPVHWGADRLHFIAAELSGERVPSSVPHVPPRTAAVPRQVDFFHDFASPYSYLGATQVAAVAAQTGAAVRWRPILLGALFRELGTPNVPLFAMGAAKQAWYAAELDRWAAHHGVPFRFPSTFPVRTVLALRVSLVAPEATMPLYEALWVHDRNIGDPQVVADVLRGLGLDADAVLSHATSSENKAALRLHSEAALAAGVCGVPSFWVDDTHLVWGQDRLPVLAELLAGWCPQGEAA